MAEPDEQHAQGAAAPQAARQPDRPWPAVAQVTAIVAASSIFAGLMLNVGFFASISWDLVGILDTSDFVSSAIGFAPPIILGCVLIPVFAVVSAWFSAPNLDALRRAHARACLGGARGRMLDIAGHVLAKLEDRPAPEPDKPDVDLPSAVQVVAIIAAMALFGGLVSWAFGATTLAGVLLATISTGVLVGFLAYLHLAVTEDGHIRWGLIVLAGIAFLGALCTSQGVKKADGVWGSGSQTVSLRSEAGGATYRVLETFGRGVVARDLAGNVLFVPWSNVDRLTIARPRRG